MANSDIELEYEFRKQLLDEYNSKNVNSVLMLKVKMNINVLMDELKKATGVSSKSRSEYSVLYFVQVNNVNAY